jgi:hypothetical protein
MSVVFPTRPARLQVPGHGVTLNVPAGARNAIFQARVAVESADSLERPPRGEVLRVVRIEIFDALGRPVADPAPQKPLDLVIKLAPQETHAIAAITGSDDDSPLAISLQRFEPDAGEDAWLEVPLREISGDQVAASLDHLSLFALVARRSGPEDAGGLSKRTSDRPGSMGRPDILISRRSTEVADDRRQVTAIAIAAGIAFGSLVAMQVAAWLVRRSKTRSRSP